MSLGMDARLPGTIDLRTLADAEHALRELGDLRGARKSFEATLNDELAQARDRFARRCVWHCGDGTRVTFDEREAALVKGLDRYVTDHRDELIVEGKSRQLDHGVVGFKERPPSVEPIKGKTEKAVLDRLRDKCMGPLMTALRAIRLGVKAHNDKLVRVKVELNKVGILAAWRAGDVDEAQLKKHELRIVRGEEAFFCEPNAHELQGNLASE